MNVTAQAAIAAGALILSAIQYPRWTRKVIAPIGDASLYKPVVRARTVWAADVTGAINAVAMASIGLLFSSTRIKAAMIFGPLLIACWFFVRIEHDEKKLNSYPGLPPWRRPSRWGSFRIVPQVVTPGVSLQVLVLVVFSL